MTTVEEINIFSTEFRNNPYPTYALLREESPIYRVMTPNGHPMWLITRYEDAIAALKDERFIKNRFAGMSDEEMAQMPIPEVMRPMLRNMLDLDEPDHSRLRGLVHKAFTPKLIEQMRERVQRLSHELLDAVEDKGEMEFIGDFAFPLPITIIAEILGVPAEDRNQFRAWSRVVDVQSFDDDPEAVIPQLMEFSAYLNDLIEERRQNPQDDLITALIEAEEAGDKLSAEELLSMVFLLLVAGHETTVNLLGNGTLALLQHPEQLALLRNNPSLMKSAVEELLRYDSPVAVATERFASKDLDFNGAEIQQGDAVMVVLASANRDPEQFSNPDVLDIQRDPNRHLAFGQGIHYCLGAPLARLEAHIAFEIALNRLPNLELVVRAEELEWRQGLNLRGLTALPLRF